MSTTQRPTPETDAAIISADGAWTFELKETMQRLERERNEAREYAERCKQGCINLSFAIDRIDYACGEPNEFEVSDYALHQNEEHVVQRVKEKLEAMRDELQKVCQQRDAWATRCDKLGVTAMREAIREAHEAFKNVIELQPDVPPWANTEATLALAKLQPFLKP